MVTFAFLALVLIVGALGVITLRQPVHAALALVGTLVALAVTYITLEAHFLAAVQVIVYAGAIMVLFLFVIMLLDVRGEAPPPSLRWLRPTAYLVGALVAAALVLSLLLERVPLPPTEQIHAALRGGGAGAIGEVLFSRFALAFQLVGVLLLTGIVGAVSLVQRRTREQREEAEGREELSRV